MNKAALCIILCQSLSVANCTTLISQELQSEVQQRGVKSELHMVQWRAAAYRGLTIGKSTRKDMLRIFGTPQWSGPPGDQMKDEPKAEIWYEYEDRGEFPGKLTVIVDGRSGVILGIASYPKTMPKQVAIKHFGNDYLLTRYDFDFCLSRNGGESAPLYESPEGSIISIEYRGRGVAIAVHEDDTVAHISYVKEPIGAKSSKCKQTDGVP